MEQCSYLPEGQLPQHPQGKDLPIGLGQAVEYLVDFHGSLLLRQPLLRPLLPELRLRLPPSLPAAVGQPGVLGDLAQPDPQGALPPELADMLQRPEKGLLGQLLRQYRVPAQGQRKSVDVLQIVLVNFFKIDYALTSLSKDPPPFFGGGSFSFQYF